MPAKESAEMKHAIEMIKNGTSITVAARLAGVHRNAIYNSKRYKQYVEDMKQAEQKTSKDAK